MVNASAFAQSAVAAQGPALAQIVCEGDEAARAVADATLRALSRLTGARLVCRLSALWGRPADCTTLRLTAAPGLWRLTGGDGTAQEVPAAGAPAAEAVALAQAAAGLLPLAPSRFGGPGLAALEAEAAQPGRDALLAALPHLWTRPGAAPDAALDALDAAAPEGPVAGIAAALRAMRLTLAFRASGQGDRAALGAHVAALLDRAMALAPSDPLAAWAAGTVAAMLTRRYQDAASAFRTALADDANNATVLHAASMGFVYAWDFDMALWAVRRGQAVSPGDTLGAQRGFAGALAAFHGRRFDEVAAFADAALALKPDFTNVLRLKAAALVHLGRGDEARAAMASAMASDPTETVSRNAAVNPLREFPGFHRFTEALAEAGMPA